MNKHWSYLNKTMQLQISKKDTFKLGIATLLTLRKELMAQIIQLKEILSKDEFSATAFIKADGNDSKTIAYSIYHIFRIEDIVANSLIKKSNQIFFVNNYKSRMNSDIITTGNELKRQEIVDFSSKLNLSELYNYIEDVNSSTTELLKKLNYEDMKIKITDKDKALIHALKVVGENESSIWLIDYWCSKNIQGLIKMPFSRHWIMHIEAILRIKDKVKMENL